MQGATKEGVGGCRRADQLFGIDLFGPVGNLKAYIINRGFTCDVYKDRLA